MSETNTMPDMQVPADAAPLGGVVAYLVIDGAAAASAFYQQAFGAREVHRIPGENGKLVHCHLHLFGSSVMLSDGHPNQKAPRPAGFTLTIPTSDVDGVWARAATADVTIVTPLQRMFWGDRYGEFTDPFGVNWAVTGK